MTVSAMLEAQSELLTMHDNRTANSLLSEAVKAARLTDARRRRR